jgi:hypothetical protein
MEGLLTLRITWLFVLDDCNYFVFQIKQEIGFRAF